VQRSGAIRLVHWAPWLLSAGPAYTLMEGHDRAGSRSPTCRSFEMMTGLRPR
jgi:hypothetical protein